MRGIRARLALTLVALVALTVAVIGVGSYLFVDCRAARAVPWPTPPPGAVQPVGPRPERLPAADAATFDDSGLRRGVPRRGASRSIVDFGDDRAVDFDAVLCARRVRRGACASQPRLAYQWATLDGRPEPRRRRPAPGDRARVLLRPRAPRHRGRARRSSGSALGGGALLLILLALVAARLVARGRPRGRSRPPARAAERIERGDLSARVPVVGATSSGAGPSGSTGWPTRSRTTVGRLEASQAPEPAVRGRRLARAADAADRARRRGVDHPRAPRRRCRRTPAGRGAAGRRRRAGCGRSSTT